LATERDAQLIEQVAIVGTQRHGAPERGFGLGVLPERTEGEAQSRVQIGVLGIEPHGLAVRFRGLDPSAQPAIRRRQCHPGRQESRPQPHCLQEGDHGLVETSASLQNDREVVVGAGLSGSQPNGVPKRGGGLGEAVAPLEVRRKRLAQSRILRPEAQRQAEGWRGLRRPSLPPQRQTQTEMSAGVLWSGFDDPSERLGGLRVSSLFEERPGELQSEPGVGSGGQPLSRHHLGVGRPTQTPEHARQVRPGQRVVRLQAHRLPERLGGGREVPLSLQGETQAEVGLRKVGAQQHGPTISTRGLGEPILLEQQGAELGVGRGDGRGSLDGSAKQGLGLGGSS
jgi:hypothetical protein